MSNVIRPTFGKPAPQPEEATSRHPEPIEEYVPLRVYGKAAGYMVALIRDDAAQEGPTVKIVVGAEDAHEVKAVAILPATHEGEMDAEITAMAILRTLEVIEDADDASEGQPDGTPQ